MIKLVFKFWASLILLSCSGLLCFSTLAQTDNNMPNKVNEFLHIFDTGKEQDPKIIKTMLDYLQHNIAITDKQNHLRLQPILCWNHFDISDPKEIDKAIDFANHVLTAPDVASSAETQLDLKLCRAYMQQLKGEVDAALAQYNLLVAQAYELDSHRLIADTLSIRGSIYSFQGNFTQALQDLISAQQLYESLDLKYWALANLSEIATSYRRFGDPQTAINYYQKLKIQFSQLGYDDSANMMEAEIAYALEELGENEQALQHHIINYQYWQNKLEPKKAANSAVNVAGSLIALGLVAEADNYLEQAEVLITSNDASSYSFMKLFQAQSALKKQQYDAARQYLHEAKKSFLEIKNIRGLALYYQVETQVYSAQEKWLQAYRSLQDYIQTHHELDSLQQNKRTTEMHARFNTEHIEKENKQLLELQKVKENKLIILNQNRFLQRMVLGLSCIIILILTIVAFKLSQKSKMLSVQALTDHLTQLPNRRSTYTKGEKYFASLRLEDQPLSLILFDIDYFKQVNDKFGHDVGDKALIEVAKLSHNMMRKQDLVGRVGGEEFLAILPGTTTEDAFTIAQRLIDSINSKHFDHIAPNFTLSISAGVATKTDETKFSDLLKQADKALYTAKSSGRNNAKRFVGK